jgi:hypothetical protein
MKRRKVFLGALLGVIGVAVFLAARYFRGDEEFAPPAESVVSASLQQVASFQALPQSQVTSVPKVQDLSEEEVERIVRSPLQLPRSEVLRNEVARNPHGTPRSILVLGAELGVRLRVALRSESDARVFFSHLRECVVGNSTDTPPPSVQALCFVHARQLVRRFPGSPGLPGLRDELAELDSALSPEAKNILNWMR